MLWGRDSKQNEIHSRTHGERFQLNCRTSHVQLISPGAHSEFWVSSRFMVDRCHNLVRTVTRSTDSPWLLTTAHCSWGEVAHCNHPYDVVQDFKTSIWSLSSEDKPQHKQKVAVWKKAGLTNHYSGQKRPLIFPQSTENVFLAWKLSQRNSCWEFTQRSWYLSHKRRTKRKMREF